ncbi:hypothetical protein SETIT_7G176400v2 [Setaria italica]|uniref:Secreted protein n=1 Tax=Setaria italica TaxID=4555 RepID=A0A368RWZ0_SETIT|nr:hypothetical protein SETIT_7G176400v2 [Setaria italica]
MVVARGAMPLLAVFFVGRVGRMHLCPPHVPSGCRRLPWRPSRYGSSPIVVIECCWVGEGFIYACMCSSINGFALVCHLCQAALFPNLRSPKMCFRCLAVDVASESSARCYPVPAVATSVGVAHSVGGTVEVIHNTLVTPIVWVVIFSCFGRPIS